MVIMRVRSSLIAMHSGYRSYTQCQRSIALASCIVSLRCALS
jgi:hypothetical protein